MQTVQAQIAEIAQKLSEAAGREDWDLMNANLLALDTLSRNFVFSSPDKPVLQEALKELSVAIEKTTLRKEEIRALVEKLGGAPLQPSS